MKPPSLIVYGPQGCGKTRNGRRIADYLGLSKVVELDEAPFFFNGKKLNVELESHGVLYLTNCDYNSVRLFDVQSAPFHVAMAWL